MASTNTILVSEVLNSPFAISTEEGESLFKNINSFLEASEKVTVDFKDITIIVSTFLNAAIGQLYGIYKPDFIRDHLAVTNMSNDDLVTLKLVIERAKDYFDDKDGFEDTLKQHLPDA